MNGAFDFSMLYVSIKTLLVFILHYNLKYFLFLGVVWESSHYRRVTKNLGTVMFENIYLEVIINAVLNYIKNLTCIIYWFVYLDHFSGHWRYSVLLLKDSSIFYFFINEID